VGKWAARLAEVCAAPLPPGTDRTDKRGLVAVLAVPPEGGTAEFVPALEACGVIPTPAGLVPVVACADCQHYGRHRTCAEPVAAGLLTESEGFGIVWPEPERAATCSGFAARVPPEVCPLAGELDRAEPEIFGPPGCCCSTAALGAAVQSLR